MHMLIGRIRFIRTRIEPWNVTLSPLGCTLQQQLLELAILASFLIITATY